jgi:hypothetical protein
MALGVKTAIAAITFCTCAGLHLGETSAGELLRRQPAVFGSFRVTVLRPPTQISVAAREA